MKRIKQILSIAITLFLITNHKVLAIGDTYHCGDILSPAALDDSDVCSCEGGSFTVYSNYSGSSGTSVTMVCCGVVETSGLITFCATPDGPTPTPTENDEDDLIKGIPVPDAETLNSLNPLKIEGGDESLADPGTLISKAVNNFVFPIAGIILFLMLVFGGFQMLMGAANSKSLEEGKQRVTSAIIGFIILFASYWIIQLIEIIFHLNILG